MSSKKDSSAVVAYQGNWYQAPANERRVMRPGYGKDHVRQLVLISNHFSMKVGSKIIFQYAIKLDNKQLATFEGDKHLKKLPKDLATRIFDELKRQESKNGGLFTTTEGTKVATAFDRANMLYCNAQLRGLDKPKNFQVTLPSSEIIETNDYLSQFVGATFIVSIMPADNLRIDLAEIENYYGGNSLDWPKHVIQALDVIVREGVSADAILHTKNIFPFHGQRQQLGEGVELITGHYQSVRPCASGMQLVLDKKSAAFYPNSSALQFICKFFNVGHPGLLSNIFQNGGHRALEQIIRKLRFTTFYGGYKRTHNCIGFGRKPMAQESFPDAQGNMIMMVEYFLNKYGVELQHIDLPCLDFGKKGMLVPIELAFLKENQPVLGKLSQALTSRMIRHTAATPQQRFYSIIENERKVVALGQEWIGHGQLLQISNVPEKVNGKLYAPPTIQYKNSSLKPNTGEGSWYLNQPNQPPVQLLKPATIEKWALVAVNDRYVKLSEFGDTLSRQAARMGLTIQARPDLEQINFNPADGRHRFDAIKCILYKHHKSSVVIFIGPRQSDVYSTIKSMADCKGITTQFIQSKNAQLKHCGNLILKLNAKLGGVNQAICDQELPEVLRKPAVMIIGGDVTHQGPNHSQLRESTENFSIAALVGSIDDEKFQYTNSIKVQEETNQESITQIDVMMLELLEEYLTINGRLPDHIIYYRDGVGEGQFTTVLQDEVAGMERCFKEKVPKLNGMDSMKPYQPMITLIVVQKRHNTRFRPQMDSDGKGKARNVPAGTVVDNVVTNRFLNDVFIISHHGIQGTSKPTHYIVLRDDYGLDADELNKMTYYLTHTYAKCNRSISIPAAVQYAHLAAERARHGLANAARPPMASTMTTAELARYYNDKIKVHQNLKSKLYYC